MTILLRILRQTWQNLTRHGLVSLTAILVITLLTLILNALLFASLTQKTALAQVSERLDLALSFVSEPDSFQIETIQIELKNAFPYLRSLTFISAEDAFARFLTNFADQNQQLATWLKVNSKKSPLPATLVIAADPVLHKPVLDWLATSRYAELLNLDDPATGMLASEATSKILALDQTLSRLSLIATLGFSLLTVLIIVAVLRLTLISRATEITIMRLVGATRDFIRLPFILEGVFFGLAAVLLGASIFTFALKSFDFQAFSGGLYGGLSELLDAAATDYFTSLGLLLGWQILAAIIVGVAASFLATRRYLGRELILG